MFLYTAVVEDIFDPMGADRVKVRVFGLHTDNKDFIPTEDLPWAQVLKSTDSASMSGIGHSAHGLLCGSWVKVFFEDSDNQYPVVLGSLSGFSTALANSAAFEETAMLPVEEIKVKSEVIKATPPVVAVADACEANVNLAGFYSSFGKDGPSAVLQACCDAGISNPYTKIAILANVAKECGFKPRNEVLKYSVKRAREVFPGKVASLTDQQITEKFSTEESTGNFLYGGRYGNAANEGYLYRGRGYIQITFKSNYQLAAKDTGVDLVANPDLLNVPANAAKASVKFIVRGAGGVGPLNGCNDQTSANRLVTQVIGGKGLNLDIGPGKEFLAKCDKFSKLGTVTIIPEGGTTPVAEPVGTNKSDGTVSDGLTPIDRTKISKKSIGFRDPNGVYPLDEFLNEPDTNRLTRRNTIKTIFSVKKKQRRTDIPNVGGVWAQPNPPYNTKYPYNRGYFSESGHGLEFDDTVGQERVSLFHKTGTFTETDAFGNRTNKIVGSDYTIIEKNGYIYVDGTVRLTTGGNCNITILGNANISVDGNMTTDVGGDYTVKCGGAMNFHSAGVHNIAAGGNFAADAPNVFFNSGKAGSPSTNGRDGHNIDHPEHLAESIEASEMMYNDDLPPAESEAFIEKQVAEGKITKDEVKQAEAAKPSEVDKEKPVAKIEPIKPVVAGIEGKKDIPEETMLSQYFSLAALTTKVALPSERRKVAPNKGLSAAEITANLKSLAENCLDKIKSQYPNIIITNTIRVNGNGSQHELGMAADTQYPGIAKSEYYNIAQWIKDNVLFDQLLLEYKSTGSGQPWIHISFNSVKNRRMVLTMMNNKKHSDGLANLGNI